MIIHVVCELSLTHEPFKSVFLHPLKGIMGFPMDFESRIYDEHSSPPANFWMSGSCQAVCQAARGVRCFWRSRGRSYRWSTRLQRTDTSVDALRRTQQPTCSFWDVRQLSGSCQAAGQRVFRASGSAEMIKGSIVRLEPLVGAIWNSQPRRICPPCGFQCFMPA